jgi:hypothetical protein
VTKFGSIQTKIVSQVAGELKRCGLFSIHQTINYSYFSMLKNFSIELAGWHSNCFIPAQVNQERIKSQITTSNKGG